VIPTDLNNSNENLGETRTFNVQKHSADGMKNVINSNNESALSEKNRINNSVGKTASVGNAGGMSVQSRQQIQHRSEQNGERVVNRQSVQHKVRTETGSAHGNASERIRQTASQSSAAASQTARQRQNNLPAQRQQQAVRSTSNVHTGNSTAVNRYAEKTSALKAADASISANTAQRNVSSSLSKTVNISVNNNVKQNKSEKKRKSSDEGGNTVISIVKAIVYIIFVITISVFLAIGIIQVGNDIFAFVKSDESVEVTIPEYATLDQVSQILYENDIIKYPEIFKLFAVYKKDDGEFLAGTYTVNGMMNYETLLAEFKEKVVYSTIDVTIPEGYTTDEIIDLFVNQYGIGTKEGFIDVIQNYDFDYWFIDELEESGRLENRIYRLDGYLFPDTYQFYSSTSEVTVISKMLKRFSQIFTKEYRNQCAEFGYSVDEMITLASMIEKEAASPSEFFLVSSVFHNRLNNKWNFRKLKSDATVLYVLRHESGEKLTLTASDLQYDTPYNTYLYEGLPPGPIANPSASAMLAALSPQTTNYYYFVANKGTTYFSETKAQHDAYIEEFKNETTEQQTTGDVPQN
jgi:UPF0755 protein